MKRVIAIGLLASCLWAEDLYIAQTAAGANNGSSCANAHSAAWFNTAGNWGGGAGEIDPGDTAHLCGTISTALTVQASGSSGNVTTVVFETGAKMSTTHWGSPGQAINLSSKSYIVIDGGTNGIIEATANGTALTYQDYDHVGVRLASPDNVEVKNLTIQNMFVRTPGTGGTFGANGVRLTGTATNTSVHDNTISYLNGAVYFAFSNGSSNVSIYNNTITHGANGIVVGNNGASVLNGINIYGNTLNLYDDSSDASCGNTFHADGIQVFAQTAGSNIQNLKIYNNTIGPEMGECSQKTGWIFLEGLLDSPLIFNNLLLLRAGIIAPTNGFIFDKPASGDTRATGIYNNTIVSAGQAGTGIGAEEDGSTVENNILVNLNYGVYGSPGVADYNLYYGNDTNGDTGGNNVFADPDLDGTYKPQVGSPAIGAGVDLTSLGITALNSDKAGVSRGAAWDAGAYQYAEAEPEPPGSPGLHRTIRGHVVIRGRVGP